MSLVLGLKNSCSWPPKGLSLEGRSLVLASAFFWGLGLNIGLKPCVLDSTSEARPVLQFLWNICTTFPKSWKKSPPKLEDYESQSFIINQESAYSFTAADILLMLQCPIAFKSFCRRSNFLKFSFDFSKCDLAY